MGIQIGMGNLCAIFAANMYRDQDAPRYILGGTLSNVFCSFIHVTREQKGSQ
jgi:hypothetical protein